MRIRDRIRRRLRRVIVRVDSHLYVAEVPTDAGQSHTITARTWSALNRRVGQFIREDQQR